MRKIEALIRPFWLDKVKDSLAEIGVEEIIITDVRSSAKENKKEKSYLAEDYIIEFMPRIKIEILTEKAKEKNIIAAIKKIAESSEANDLKIIISDIEIV